MQKIPIDKTRYILFDEVNNTAIVVWILNRAVDFFRRYQSGK